MHLFSCLPIISNTTTTGNPCGLPILFFLCPKKRTKRKGSQAAETTPFGKVRNRRGKNSRRSDRLPLHPAPDLAARLSGNGLHSPRTRFFQKSNSSAGSALGAITILLLLRGTLVGWHAFLPTASIFHGYVKQGTYPENWGNEMQGMLTGVTGE